MTFLRFVRLLGVIALVASAAGVRAQIPYQYVYPKAPFDPVWAEAQMGPGTATLRGTLTVKERKALIKALNISKGHRAPRGTIVTLFPHTKHLEEWLALDKKLSRQATLQKAAMTPEALSYRFLTKVTDDEGGFEFTGLKPGRYFVYAMVNYVDAGTVMEQTGSVDSYIGGARVESIPTFTSSSYAINMAKAATAVVEIASEGQVVVTTIVSQ